MTVDGQEFKSALRRVALERGCVAFGVTDAGPVADHERLDLWLRRGWHGSMGYLERDRATRQDPRRLLPGARSVICVALPCARPPAPPVAAPAGHPRPDTAPTGRLASLFAGQDYHQVMHAVLQALSVEGARLGSAPSTWLPAVDTRPLLERSLAVRAGLGAIGRNTQLIVPGHGSFLCIGLLLTDALLPPDAPSGLDPCGRCDACLRACPTGALHDGQGLEAPRCLSYLTTASHDPIPADLRPKLGLRVYGCDDCQSSCPWNLPPRHHGHAPHPNLEGDASVARATLESWLEMPSRQLRRTLAGTALHWLSPRALRRTACVVLGNLGDPSSRPALERAAQQSSDPQLGDHAAWALSRLPPARP